MMLNKRKANGIDLFRLLIVFGVCLIHAYGLSGHKYISRMLEPCVVAFAFISGWFGVDFKWRKTLSLCGIGVYCAVVGAALSLLGTQDVTMAHFLKTCFKTYGGFWYLHAYLVMMVFAPMINLQVRTAILSGGG